MGRVAFLHLGGRKQGPDDLCVTEGTFSVIAHLGTVHKVWTRVLVRGLWTNRTIGYT